MNWKISYIISFLFLISAVIFKDQMACILGLFWMNIAHDDLTNEKIKALENKVNFWMSYSK